MEGGQENHSTDDGGATDSSPVEEMGPLLQSPEQEEHGPPTEEVVKRSPEHGTHKTQLACMCKLVYWYIVTVGTMIICLTMCIVMLVELKFLAISM